MKKLSLLLFVSLIFACGNSNIEDIDFSKINEPCDLVESAGIILDRGIDIQQEYKDVPEDELPQDIVKEIEIFRSKMDEIEECYHRNQWEREDLEGCPNFNEINRKGEEIRKSEQMLEELKNLDVTY